MSTWIAFELRGPGVQKLEESSHDFDFEEDELHTTLAFLGQEDMYDEQMLINKIVEEWLKKTIKLLGPKSGDAFKGTLSRCMYFGFSHVALVNVIHDLYEARLNLVTSLKANHIPVDETFEWEPHVTFGFQPDWENTHLAPAILCSEWKDDWGQEIQFPGVFVVCGEKRTAFEVDHSQGRH